MTRLIAVALSLAIASSAQAGIRISEWMYSGNGAEFVEFCNFSGNPVNMTGWSYDDDSQLPGQFDLSLFGNVVPGECVVITEGTAGAFNSAWGLGGTVKILGGYVNNLGRNDEINLFDQNGDLVDRLTYGDQNFVGSIRTQLQSGWVSPAGVGQNDVYEWTLSTVGDVQGSWESSNGDIGNPGRHTPIIPEPGTLALLGLGVVGLLRRR